jgi:eukaryotic-like serine/threonine-protein kinase
MNELAGRTLSGYTLIEEVGHGSMGVVYRGKQLALQREVAIKVLPKALARDATYVARFIREAQIIAGLNHPNIVQIYDAGQQQNQLYFVMEFVEGPTLASLLHLDGMVPQHLASEYAAQIAEALQCAYMERHVIHRDIKPENLMLDRWGRIKVMDFGLARAPGLQRITLAKTLVGSIYYSSPEQIWGQVLDNRSDVYALGVVLYEMVCGQRPFQGKTMPILTQNIVRGNPQPPRYYNQQIAPELEEIILTALALDRDQRYSQALEMAEALRSLNLPHPDAHLQQSSVIRAVAIQPPKRPSAQRPPYLDPQPSGAGSWETPHPEQRGNKLPTERERYLPAIRNERSIIDSERSYIEAVEAVRTSPLEPVPKNRGIWSIFRRAKRQTGHP